MIVTFTNDSGTATEQLDLASDMDISELKGLLEAFLGVPANSQALVSNGRELGDSGSLQQLGIKGGDMILVINKSARVDSGSSSGGTSSATANTAARRNPFSQVGSSAPVQWEGMSFHDVFENNTDPKKIATILRGSESLMKELRFHNQKLADAMSKDEESALSALRAHMMMESARRAMAKINAREKEAKMQKLRAEDPNNAEVVAYYAEKESEQLVIESYTRMMNDYPETLTSVLMLYIEVEVNGVPVQAFVDSGAQTSVISAHCAERIGVTKLIDKRFAGSVVGVGQGKTLGRVHIVPLNIAGNFFPVSLTVMDDSKGLGDKNMEFLLGLDMLKRHRANIDLVEGVLKFQGANGFVSTPFLHEKDLPQNKGGTKGFDPNKAPVKKASD